MYQNQSGSSDFWKQHKAIRDKANKEFERLEESKKITAKRSLENWLQTKITIVDKSVLICSNSWVVSTNLPDLERSMSKITWEQFLKDNPDLEKELSENNHSPDLHRSSSPTMGSPG